MARNAKPAPEQQAIVAWFTRPREREPNGTDDRNEAAIAALGLTVAGLPDETEPARRVGDT